MQAKWKESLDTEELIRGTLPSLSEAQLEKYVKQIGTIWQVFLVTLDPHSWTVAKSHDQIQEFIIKYNLRFKAKLVFGTFMMKGLGEVCSNPDASAWEQLLQFLQCEELAIEKVKCMPLLKKSGGRYKDFCCRLPWQWNQREFVIIRSGVLYYSKSKEPKEYLPFGASFKLFKGKEDTGYEFGIRLEANHRKLLLYAPAAFEFFQFLYFITETQRQALSEAEHRFNSFAPVRRGNHVEFFADGQDYFRAVAEAIERAEEQIMISGWFISPQFQMVRPVSQHKDQRFDLLLKRAAQRGLRIFVLVYNESSFLTNDSTYVKQTLESLSPSVKVLQHPLGVLPTFWSHHEKLVIIDQCEAFMGGLDIGFARFDDSRHLITANDPDHYPGLEYNNIRSVDLTKVREFWRDGVERDRPRLPWHDVALRLRGESVADLSHHFIEYWNYASFQTYYQDRYVLVLRNERPKPFLRKIGEGIANKFQGIKDFAGQLKKKIFRSEQSEPTKEMREEEIKVEFKEGDGSSESNLVKMVNKPTFRFSQSWQDNTSPNVFREESMKSSSETEKEMAGGAAVRFRKFTSVVELDDMVEEMGDKIEKIDFIDDLRVTKKRDTLHEIPEEIEEDFGCQALRSVGSWSIGCQANHRERSVHTAYLDLIRNAKRFIYIQNQFFISSTPDSTGTVKNEIANEIFGRVERAVREKQEFRVWVVIPLVPGFAGELDDPEAVIPRVIMHWQYNTICRGPHSLLARIAALGVDPSQHVQFFGLRTHGVIAGRAHTEIVYIHSKLMIVDDERAICGSANINERSMRGTRDSQVCLVIEEGPQKMISHQERNFTVSETIHNFRMRLFHQHFGADIDATDPSREEFKQKVSSRVAHNTELYRRIFHCYPDDHVPTLPHLTALREEGVNEELYEQVKEQIVGFAVQFPLLFLKDENLLVGATLYPDSLSV